MTKTASTSPKTENPSHLQNHGDILGEGSTTFTLLPPWPVPFQTCSDQQKYDILGLFYIDGRIRRLCGVKNIGYLELELVILTLAWGQNMKLYTWTGATCPNHPPQLKQIFNFHKLIPSKKYLSWFQRSCCPCSVSFQNLQKAVNTSCVIDDTATCCENPRLLGKIGFDNPQWL